MTPLWTQPGSTTTQQVRDDKLSRDLCAPQGLLATSAAMSPCLDIPPLELVGSLTGASDETGALLKMGSTAAHTEEVLLVAFASKGGASALPAYTSSNP